MVMGVFRRWVDGLGEELVLEEGNWVVNYT